MVASFKTDQHTKRGVPMVSFADDANICNFIPSNSTAQYVKEYCRKHDLKIKNRYIPDFADVLIINMRYMYESLNHGHYIVNNTNVDLTDLKGLIGFNGCKTFIKTYIETGDIKINDVLPYVYHFESYESKPQMDYLIEWFDRNCIGYSSVCCLDIFFQKVEDYTFFRIIHDTKNGQY